MDLDGLVDKMTCIVYTKQVILYLTKENSMCLMEFWITIIGNDKLIAY